MRILNYLYILRVTEFIVMATNTSHIKFIKDYTFTKASSNIGVDFFL